MENRIPTHADSERHLLQTVLAGNVVLPMELRQLQSQLTGDVILPSDSRYDQLTARWNGRYDRHPALLVQPVHAADVAAAITFAREHELPLAVRGGGNSAVGESGSDGGLTIDLAQMKDMTVDSAT